MHWVFAMAVGMLLVVVIEEVKKTFHGKKSSFEEITGRPFHYN